MSGISNTARPLLIALGHPFRSDDAAGLRVLENIREKAPDRFELIHHNGDPSDLIDLWRGRQVLVVDAAPADSTSGSLHIFDALAAAQRGTATGEARLADTEVQATSSHALSLTEALGLGRLLEKLPQSMTVVAVAGEDFTFGDRLSPRTEQAIAAAVRWIVTVFPSMESGGNTCTKAL